MMEREEPGMHRLTDWDENDPTTVSSVPTAVFGADDHTPRCCSHCGKAIGDEEDAVIRGALVVLRELRLEMLRKGASVDEVTHTIQRLINNAGLVGAIEVSHVT